MVKEKNALMSSQAMGLSDEDIEDLAAYYNSIPADKGSLQADDDIIALGQNIYRGGIYERMSQPVFLAMAQKD